MTNRLLMCQYHFHLSHVRYGTLASPQCLKAWYAVLYVCTSFQLFIFRTLHRWISHINASDICALLISDKCRSVPLLAKLSGSWRPCLLLNKVQNAHQLVGWAGTFFSLPPFSSFSVTSRHKIKSPTLVDRDPTPVSKLKEAIQIPFATRGTDH